MRTMKKTIAFVLAFAMAFATAFSAVGKGVTASATAAPAMTVKLNTDGSFDAINVEKELQVGVVTIKKGVATIKNWDTYKATDMPVKGGVISTDDDAVATPCVQGFITLTPKKDTVIAFRTVATTAGDGESAWTSNASYTKPIFWEIQKNTTKYKATIGIDKSADEALLKVNDVFYNKANYSVHSALLGDDDDVVTTGTGIINDKIYNVGGVIEVTPKGKGAGSGLTSNISKFSYLDDDDITIPASNIIQADAKKVNVKLKKRANAPVVSINYVKSTATIPKNSQYRIITESANWGVDYTTSSDKKAVELSGDEGLIQIKKSATDKALASKTGVATYAAAAALENENGDSLVGAEVSDGLKVSYKDGGDLTLENKSSKDVIEYFVGTAAPTSAAKWTKIKVNGKSVIKAAKVDKKAKVYARRAANAKNFLIAGAVCPREIDEETDKVTITGYDYAAAAEAGKTVLEPTKALSPDNKKLTITFGAAITGVANVKLNSNAASDMQINGTSLEINSDDAITSYTVTVTLSDESARTYKFKTSATPTYDSKITLKHPTN